MVLKVARFGICGVGEFHRKANETDFLNPKFRYSKIAITNMNRGSGKPTASLQEIALHQKPA